jgi:hypothetical protein
MTNTGVQVMIEEIGPDKLMVLDIPVLHSKRPKTKFEDISSLP